MTWQGTNYTGLTITTTTLYVGGFFATVGIVVEINAPQPLLCVFTNNDIKDEQLRIRYYICSCLIIYD